MHKALLRPSTVIVGCTGSRKEIRVKQDRGISWDQCWVVFYWAIVSFWPASPLPSRLVCISCGSVRRQWLSLCEGKRSRNSHSSELTITTEVFANCEQWVTKSKCSSSNIKKRLVQEWTDEISNDKEVREGNDKIWISEFCTENKKRAERKERMATSLRVVGVSCARLVNSIFRVRLRRFGEGSALVARAPVFWPAYWRACKFWRASFDALKIWRVTFTAVQKTNRMTAPSDRHVCSPHMNKVIPTPHGPAQVWTSLKPEPDSFELDWQTTVQSRLQSSPERYLSSRQDQDSRSVQNQIFTLNTPLCPRVVSCDCVVIHSTYTV